MTDDLRITTSEVRGLRRWPAPLRTQAWWLLAGPALIPVATIPLALPLAFLQAIPAVHSSEVPFPALLQGLIGALAAAVIGVLLARRLLRSRGWAPAGPRLGAAAALPVIGGLLVLNESGALLLVGAGLDWMAALAPLVAALCLLLLLPPAAWAVAVASGQGRRIVAWVGTGLAGLLLSAAATLAGAGMAALREPQAAASWWGLGVLPAVVLVLAHANRLARPAPAPAVVTEPEAAEPEAAGPKAAEPGIPVPQAPPITRSRWWHRILLGAALCSLLAWALTLAYLTPNIGEQSSLTERGLDPLDPNPITAPPDDPAGWPGWTWVAGRLWMQELQLLGIACTVLCLMAALAYRGRPLRPVLGAGALLLIADLIVVHQDWATPAILPGLVAGGLLVGAAAWSVSTRGGPQPPERARRLVITLTLLPLFLLPYPFIAHDYVDRQVGDQRLPLVLLLVVAGLPAVLATVTAMGVRATSHKTRARPGHPPAWRIALAPVLLAAGVALAYQPGLIPHPTDTSPWWLPLLIFQVPLALPLPLLAWTGEAIRGGALTARRIGVHLLLTPALLVTAGGAIPFVFILGLIVSRTVLSPMAYDTGYLADDGFPYLPGALPAGLLVAVAAAAYLTRPGPAAAPGPDVAEGPVGPQSAAGVSSGA